MQNSSITALVSIFSTNKISLDSFKIFPDEIELTIVRDHALDTILNMIMCLYENFFIV